MKKLIGIIMIVGLALGATAAEEKKESGLSAWLTVMQKKLEQLVPKKSLPLTTGVAGTRGAKEDAKPKLYWKGKAGEEPVSEEELAEFKAAVGLAGQGDTAAAAKALEKFMQQYPDSALVPDARKTLDMVKSEADGETVKQTR